MHIHKCHNLQFSSCSGSMLTVSPDNIPLLFTTSDSNNKNHYLYIACYYVPHAFHHSLDGRYPKALLQQH